MPTKSLTCGGWRTGEAWVTVVTSRMPLLKAAASWGVVKATCFLTSSPLLASFALRRTSFSRREAARLDLATASVRMSSEVPMSKSMLSRSGLSRSFSSSLVNSLSRTACSRAARAANW